MSELKQSGKVIQVLKEESGTGKKGEWVKGGFVIETSDQYPKKIVFQVWGDLVKEIPSKGSDATVHFNVESREFNERWYTDLKVWKIEGAKSAPQTEKKTEKKEVVKTGLGLEENDDDLPF
jgi:hypothetical protein